MVGGIREVGRRIRGVEAYTAVLVGSGPSGKQRCRCGQGCGRGGVKRGEGRVGGADPARGAVKGGICRHRQISTSRGKCDRPQ